MSASNPVSRFTYHLFNQRAFTRNFAMRAPILRNTACLAGALFVCSLAGNALDAQDPAQPSTPAPSAESSSKKTATSQNKPSHSDDFLVRGTVFTPEGLALPGAELRIRRSAEKKFKWDTVSNSRGDFAVRVKMGSDYEISARAKGYQEQSQSVDAKTGERYKNLVFRLQRQEGKKK